MYSSAGQSILASYNSYKTTSSKTNTSTTKKSTPIVTTLGSKTIAAQQKLSNKYGISTFNTKGTISTVPTVQSGGFSDIYVGLGAYSTFDDYANAAVEKAIAQEKTARSNGGGITFTNGGGLIPAQSPNDPIIVPDPTAPTRYVDVAKSANSQNPILTNKSPDEQGLQNLADQAKDFIQHYGIWIGAIIAVPVLLKMFKVIK